MGYKHTAKQALLNLLNWNSTGKIVVHNNI